MRWSIIAGAGGALLLLFLALLLIWGGPAKLRSTLEFTTEYQALRPDYLDRLARTADAYADRLLTPAGVVAVLAGLVAIHPGLGRRRWIPLAIAGASLLVATLLRATPQPSLRTFAWTSGVTGTVMFLVLVPSAVMLSAAQRGRSEVRALLVVGVPATAVGGVFIAAMTTSSSLWGATAAVLTPGLFAVSVAVLSRLRESGRGSAAVVAAVLVATLAVAHTATSFRSPPLGEIRDRVSIGANAGLWSSPEAVRQVEDVTRFASTCAGRTALAYSAPAALVLADADPATPIIWLGGFQGANRWVVGWLEERKEVPDCVIVPASIWPPTAKRRLSDPLLDWLADRYAMHAVRDRLVILMPRAR